MDTFSPNPQRTEPATHVVYDTDAFTDAARSVAARHDDGSGPILVFKGGTREHRQQALATLTRYATGNVHQFRMPALLDPRRMQTQNNLRKAFDHAAEEDALLYFDATDALFAHTPTDPLDGEGEAEPTVAEYFFERVEAHPGLVLLGIKEADVLDHDPVCTPDVVVGFSPTS